MFEQLRNTYNGKKVLLTGHTGFKGSWLLLLLHELGAEVKGYALEPKTGEDLYHQINGNALCDSVIADLRDRERLAAETQNFKPDFVFHMAAQALVLNSYKDPIYTYETNVMGTAHMLDALRGLENECHSVFITTDKVYENYEKDYAYDEEDRLGGFDPYSNSKAACELVIDSYRRSFMSPDRFEEHGQGISSARSGNVIGGGDYSEYRIVPDLAKALARDEKLIVRSPRAVRPWQHVLDPLNGYLVLGMKMKNEGSRYFQAFNFGPEVEDKLSVEELIKIGIHSWGYGDYEIQSDEGQPHEAGLLMLNNKKAKDMLGWTPRFNAEQAIHKTIEWYKDARGNEKQYCLDQIRQFYS